MKLTFHHNLGSENTDLLAYSLYTTLSATNTVTTVSASELTLAASTSKPVKLSAQGTFELTDSKKPYIKAGIANSLSIKRASKILGHHEFDIVSVSNAKIDTADLMMCEFSLKTAEGVAKKLLRKSDTIIGSDGDDYLAGYRGDDLIEGREGADIMYGGAGRDTFTYSKLEDSGTYDSAMSDGYVYVGGVRVYQSGFNDTIIDFKSRHDSIDLSAIGNLSKKHLNITDLSNGQSATDYGYSLVIDKDLDGVPEMIIDFLNTPKPLRMSDIILTNAAIDSTPDNSNDLVSQV